MLLVTLDLENLFVDRRGFGKEALIAQVVCNPGVLSNGFVDLSCPHVQIAQDIGGIPVAWLIFDDLKIFRDRRIESSLAQQLFSFS